MRLNIEKLDNQLRKLQEIRRIASDPEMMELLSEFLSSEESLRQRPAEVSLAENGMRPAAKEPGPAERDEVGDVVNEVLQRSEHAGNHNSMGLWSRRKS